MLCLLARDYVYGNGKKITLLSPITLMDDAITAQVFLKL